MKWLKKKKVDFKIKASTTMIVHQGYIIYV